MAFTTPTGKVIQEDCSDDISFLEFLIDTFFPKGRAELVSVAIEIHNGYFLYKGFCPIGEERKLSYFFKRCEIRQMTAGALLEAYYIQCSPCTTF